MNAHLPKTLVICCDGTWQKSDDPHVSNVEKIARSIAPHGHDGQAQIVYYMRGVGSTGSRIERLLAGAFGIGLDDNIVDCYSFLALNYEPGDRISIFGFSRGAYTARSLVGMIAYVGLLRPDGLAADQLPAAMRAYRERPLPGAQAPRGHEGRLSALAAHCHSPGAVTIDMLGVFDTVGALGIPGLSRAKYRFHDVDLSAKVCRARQAVALAERRRLFVPCLWGGAHRDIRQVWFDGVHRDVGGGYENCYYSDRALLWMIGEAAQRGRLRESVRPGQPCRPCDYDDYPGLKFDWARLEPTLCTDGPIDHDSLGLGYRIANALAALRGLRAPRRPDVVPAFRAGWRTLAPSVETPSAPHGRAYDVRIERTAAQRGLKPNEERWIDEVRRLLQQRPDGTRGTVDPAVLENLYVRAPDFAELTSGARPVRRLCA